MITPASSPQANFVFKLIQQAFIRRSHFSQVEQSKRFPNECLDTGPEAATKYRLKHPAIIDRVSSIHKLQRASRIELRLRPLNYGIPTRRERRIIAKELARATR
jgi:hypothetical protein